MSDIVKNKKPRGYWIRENVEIESKKYKTRLDFKLGCAGAFSVAYHGGYLDDVCKHMTTVALPKNFWNKKKCIEEAKKYSNRTDMRNGSRSMALYARKHGFLDEICAHMDEDALKSKDPATLELFMSHKLEAEKYKTRHKFFLGSTKIYTEAIRNKWINKICKHMPI